MTATLPGVRPIIALASRPMANGWRKRLSIVTQEGSLMTIPLPRTFTSVFAVPDQLQYPVKTGLTASLSG